MVQRIPARFRDFGSRQLNAWADEVARLGGDQTIAERAMSIGYPVTNEGDEFMEAGYVYGADPDTGAYKKAVSALVAVAPFFLVVAGGGSGQSAFVVSGGVFPVQMEDEAEVIAPGSIAWVSSNTAGTVTAVKPTGSITRYAVGRFKDGTPLAGRTEVLLNFDLRGS